MIKNNYIPDVVVLLRPTTPNRDIKVIDKGQLVNSYKETDVANYMKGQAIDISINLNMGLKKFTAYTMDLTKKYIEINADYRS